MIKKLLPLTTVLFLLILVACQPNIEEEQKIVEEFIKQTPTYQNDNPELTLIKYEQLAKNHYLFTYSYTSSYAGYGKREGGFYAAVMTEHEIKVEIKEKQIVKATLDEKYDVLEQELIE